MVEFALPKNSKISGGKTWPKPANATETREFKVYRWNPDDGKNPSVDTYYVDTHECGPMVLDEGHRLIHTVHGGIGDIGVTDRSLIWNSDLVETLEFDNLIVQAVVTMESAANRTLSLIHI